MTVDDDRRYGEIPKPPSRARRIGCVVVALLLSVCLCGGLATALLNARDDGSREVGPVALSAGGIVAVALLTWGSYALARTYWQDWRLRISGEVVLAVIEETYPEYDSEAGYSWRARVSGRTNSGHAFNRKVYLGFQEPQVGSRVEVRYHPANQRITAVDRGFGAIVTAFIGHVLVLGLLVLMLYCLGAVGYGLYRLWT
ncbi:DUF3592 domain-containing protein [Catellatospora tritici]|uniref:DUF3592 domain-containing protein n=1 Tax=Catellatospora tritici TaxID=2851566 RepID=UPI001C2CEAF1|nr:hypothetical protein [Catellatospora tritici]MBV1849407.1 hypothetical protein [Catellatospora tritici]